MQLLERDPLVCHELYWTTSSQISLITERTFSLRCLSFPPLVPLADCAPPSLWHAVHMAPACDTMASQNTPDARLSSPLFQALLIFKQNKGKGGGRAVRATGMCNNMAVPVHSLVVFLCIIDGERSPLNLSRSPPSLPLSESPFSPL